MAELSRHGQFVYGGVVVDKQQKAGKRAAFFTITVGNMGEKITFMGSQADFNAVGVGQQVKVSGIVRPRGQYNDPSCFAEKFEVVTK